MEDAYFSDSDLVYHVREALVSVHSGEGGSYHQLVGVMHHSKRLGPDEVALLVTSLKAISGAVSYIDNIHHNLLLNSIFGMSMWNYSPDVMDALLELIVSLAASDGKFIDSCLDMLVRNFMPPFGMVEMLKQPRGQPKKEQVLSHVHKALQDITNLVPMAASRLSSIVVERMPTTFKKDLENELLKYRVEIYIENMLRLESGAIREFVGSRMLMAVVDMLIELDVAIGWDDILRDDSCKGIFAIELEDSYDLGDDDGEDISEVSSCYLLNMFLDSKFLNRTNHLDFISVFYHHWRNMHCILRTCLPLSCYCLQWIILQIMLFPIFCYIVFGNLILKYNRWFFLQLPRTLSYKSLGKNMIADLLDSLMVRTFEHLELCASNKCLGEVFETLVDSFMLTILNTYKSKFAQFVMFYTCALDPESCGVKFTEMLVDRFLCGDNPLTRMSAVAYLASYLARAKFLSPAFVASTLQRLVEWCSEYCKVQDGNINPKAHRIFYSGCQAIMYVLCFRLRTIMDISQLRSQFLLMPIEPILKHDLGALKVCLPSIVEDF